MITMRRSTHGFPFLSYDYGAPLGGPSGRWSSAITTVEKLTLLPGANILSSRGWGATIGILW